MKITKVSYGRTIEVGGPFGRRLAEKVWFGWDAEVSDHLCETEEQVLAELRAMADKQEAIEREDFEKRLRERRDR